jgi:RHS repeat-associated protein
VRRAYRIGKRQILSILRIYCSCYYDANKNALSYTDVDSASSAPAGWTEQSGDFTTPSNAAYMRVQLLNYMNSGWVAWDDLQLTGPQVTISYYYAGGQRVAMRKNGVLRWLAGDHLGSTAVTAYADGVKGTELRYEAFGETRYAWGDTPTTRRFTGQVEDDTIGLYFYNARYYDAALGRFVQADTVVPGPTDPQAFNRYSYVRNNPLKYVDPSGHDDNPFDVGGWGGGGGGGGGGEAIGLLIRLVLEVLISSLMPDLPGPAEVITLIEPSTAARNREIAESVEQAGQWASLVRMAATVTIVGTPDADHEKAQVKRFGQLVGGGEMEFFGDAQPGVEGEFTPTGSNESFPLSLKDFTQTGKMGNVIGRINDNANKVANAGYAGNAVLHAETTQWDAESFMNFVEGGPIKNMPFEGVFERLYFNCSDGIVVVDGSGVSIID